ncbi:indoleamine 2,3-dioxygenase 2 isoform X4 [Balaenoptera musculus]|uniref:Indoleamine 2,3-dioxygenase 2 n=1 Tax=Balaenoptera musculus TaxID=9771 RepID=A0A8B8WBE4_BALMU|nr:indoleamine 2,3-dioxygenase 2 isoform X4 [Balaenoptera musculus]
MEPESQNLKTAPPLTLGRFHISEDYGFLLPNPLKKLPDHYRPWMEIASRLPHLIGSHQLRAQVNEMPLLNCQFLTGYREQRLAHLVLTFITMGYVWQDGEAQPKETPGNQALVQAVNAVLLPSPDSLLQALQRLRISIQDITRALGQMHDYVDPDIFYSVIRIFFSGWKDNPAMPAGLLYEGVSKEPLNYSGASAAQSSVLHAFDEFLGVRHSKESADFLHRMRDYMPPSHRAFIEEIHSAPSLRDHILSSGNSELLTAHNQCVEALAALRSYHLAMVTKYLITAAPKAKGRRTSHLPGPPQALEDRGTGGTAVVRFLKSVRDKTLEAILHQSG